MIQIEELMFSYRGHRVYDGLTTKFEQGRIYGLLGRNGAGKTTLLRLISGLMKCDGGKILANGHEPFSRSPEFLDRIFLLPESFNAPETTITELASEYGSFYSGFNYDALLQYLSALEVSPTIKISRMSFGQGKKAMIAFALSLNTDILLLDEPGNGLDIPSKLCLRRILADCRTDGRILLLSTHQVRDIADIIDHVTVIDRGRLLVNTSVTHLNDKLMTVRSTSRISGVLFSEQVHDGYIHVLPRENLTCQEGENIDLEILFNACITNRKEVCREL